MQPALKLSLRRAPLLRSGRRSRVVEFLLRRRLCRWCGARGRGLGLDRLRDLGRWRRTARTLPNVRATRHAANNTTFGAPHFSLTRRPAKTRATVRPNLVYVVGLCSTDGLRLPKASCLSQFTPCLSQFTPKSRVALGASTVTSALTSTGSALTASSSARTALSCDASSASVSASTLTSAGASALHASASGAASDFGFFGLSRPRERDRDREPRKPLA